MSKVICQFYLDCEFFKRFGANVSERDSVTMFHEIADVYCFGKLRSKCVRFIHRNEHGTAIADEIAPNGLRYAAGPGPGVK